MPSRIGKRSAARSRIPQECHTSRKRLAATGQPLAQFLVIERGDKKLLQIAVPPVALIQPGVQVKIDNAEPTGVKYVVCTPGECLALGEINADFIAKLKKGGILTITMLNPQGKPVNFEISLVGFTAVYDGPGINPEQAQARAQRLEDELKKKADEARQQLLDLQQQQTEARQQLQRSCARGQRPGALPAQDRGLDLDAIDGEGDTGHGMLTSFELTSFDSGRGGNHLDLESPRAMCMSRARTCMRPSTS